MEQRYFEIAMKYAPKGIKIRWKRGKKLTPAWADLDKKAMLVPRPKTREALYIFLHECAHYHLKHFEPTGTDCPKLRLAYTGNGRLAMAQEEYEAERWTHHTLRMEGVKVPKSMSQSAKEYVKECIKARSKAHHPEAVVPPRVEIWAS